MNRAFIKSWLAMLLAVVLAGCGGSSGGSKQSGPGGPDRGAETGVFLDAEVEGLSYQANPSGQSGTTNAAGEFLYLVGDNVSFSVGAVELGSAPAGAVMTPHTLAAAIDANDLAQAGITVKDVALNIAIFLQSFDSAGGNGISIDSSVAEAATQPLNFMQIPEAFVESPDLLELASNAGDGYDIVMPEQAEEHLNNTLFGVLEGSWLVDPDTEPGSSMAVLTIFPDGRYALGIAHDDPECSDGVEYGTYELNGSAMTFQATGIVTTDNTGPGGDCGLYEDGAGEVLSITLDGNHRFSIHSNEMDEEGDEPIVLNRVVNNGFHGSWTEWDEGGDAVAVITILEDSTYMIAQLDLDAGVEVGRYMLNGNILEVVEVYTDTNGDAGLHDPQSGETGAVALSTNDHCQLVVTDDDGDYIFTPNPDVSGGCGGIE